MRILERWIDLPGGASRLPAMEGLRAYAAAVVFQVHFFGAWAHESTGVDLDSLRLQTLDDSGLALVYYFSRSHYGVDLFFFLSGFLVFGLVTQPGFHYGRFLRDRLLRLYPVLLVTTCGIGVAYYGWAHLGSTNLLQNLLLLNGLPGLGVTPINAPTWSLLFELGFYAGFPAILLLRRRGARLGSPHILGLAALVLFVTRASPGYAWRGVFFFAGAWLACQDGARLRRWARELPDGWVLAGFLAATTSYAFFPRFESFVWVFLAPCTALCLVVLHGNGFLARGFSARPLRAFGNLSYSFYLVHAFAVGVVFHFFRELLPMHGSAAPIVCVAAYLASFGLSTLLAAVLFECFERPYFVWKQRQRAARVALREDASTGSAAILAANAGAADPA